MNEAEKDTARAQAAARAIVDRRPLDDHQATIMVTLEHTVAAVLLALYGSPALAAAMLNEGLVPGVEQRLSLYTARNLGEPS